MTTNLLPKEKAEQMVSEIHDKICGSDTGLSNKVISFNKAKDIARYFADDMRRMENINTIYVKIGSREKVIFDWQNYWQNFSEAVDDL